MSPRHFILVALLLITTAACAQPVYTRHLLRNPDAWLASEEGRQTLDNLLARQNADGGWWKDYDAATTVPALRPDQRSTIDNSATWGEMRLLARAYRKRGEERDRAAVERGLGYILSAQYPNGGWPQVSRWRPAIAATSRSMTTP